MDCDLVFFLYGTNFSWLWLVTTKIYLILVGKPPFLRFARQSFILSKSKHVYHFGTVFFVDCPKGARKAKLDDIRSIGIFNYFS